MTANRGLFVRNNGNVGTTPIEGRLVLASMIAENAPGVPRQGLLDQRATTVVSGASGWTYNVAPCTPVLNRATNEGVYVFTLTGTTSVATTAAPGTGSRWDLIYVKQNDLDKGDANNTATVAVLQGTASTGTPTKPTASLPAGAYVLAEALVAAGATGTNHANVTITQTWRYTALRGVAIPVRNTTERAELTPSVGDKVARLDLDASRREEETWNGTAWIDANREAEGIKFINQVTSNSGSFAGVTVVNNIASHTFKAGRRYKITWDTSFLSGGSASLFFMTIGTAAVADAASSTSGITLLGGRTIQCPIPNSTTYSGPIVAYFSPSTDTTVQIKFYGQRVAGGDLVMVVGQNGEPSTYIIEDMGVA